MKPSPWLGAGAAPWNNVIGSDPELRDPLHGDFRPANPAARRYGCRTFVGTAERPSGSTRTVDARQRADSVCATGRSTPGTVLQVGGSIASDTTWDADRVEVLADVFVEDGVTLTIAPGTRVEFADYFRLQVRGTLLARGRADRRITFTTDEPEHFAPDASTSGCWNGIRFDAKLAHNAPSVLEHCTLEYSKAVGGAGRHPRCGGGLSVEACAGVELENCVLRENVADYGGALFLYEQANVRVAGTLLASNHALVDAGALYVAYSYPTFANCTIVANRIHNQAHPYQATCAVASFVAKPRFTHCIVWGNAPDVVYQHQQMFAAKAWSTRRCDVEAWPGGGDTFALDPRFVAPASGDWRLSFASPCIDAATRLDASARPPAFDLAGLARELDGDLDTDARLDLGAHEFAPLELATSGVLGTPANARAWGEDGATATLFVARGGVSGRTLATPFGGLALEPRASFSLGSIALGSSRPGELAFTLPDELALAGERFGFQALARDAHAPALAAYTNATELTLLVP